VILIALPIETLGSIDHIELINAKAIIVPAITNTGLNKTGFLPKIKGYTKKAIAPTVTGPNAINRGIETAKIGINAKKATTEAQNILSFFTFMIDIYI
jgi:hypothetical protein